MVSNTDTLGHIHGFWGDHANWQAVVPGLSNNFQVVTYDRRGHSKSENTTNISPFPCPGPLMKCTSEYTRIQPRFGRLTRLSQVLVQHSQTGRFLSPFLETLTLQLTRPRTLTLQFPASKTRGMQSCTRGPTSRWNRSYIQMSRTILVIQASRGMVEMR